MRALVGKHSGCPAVVLGGGPSLLVNLMDCPEKAVRVSANHHGCKLTRCDYLVTNYEHLIPEFACGVPIIGPCAGADYVFFGIESTSGMQAAKTAWLMGCAPIILMGMDCYQGDRDYWDDSAEALVTYGRKSPPYLLRKLSKQLAAWKEMTDRLEGIEVRVAGGPLLNVYKKYEAALGMG